MNQPTGDRPSPRPPIIQVTDLRLDFVVGTRVLESGDFDLPSHSWQSRHSQGPGGAGAQPLQQEPASGAMPIISPGLGRSPARPLTVLDIPDFAVPEGDQLVITGPSGCGKSTFLQVLGGILVPDAGRVEVAGSVLGDLDEAGRDRWRADQVGIVFQQLNLLQGFTAMENVMLGLMFSPLGRRRVGSDERALAREALVAVGLEGRLHHRPAALSLGEQQRVAIARALVKRPRMILADEPTGSLDPRNAAAVAALLRRACSEHGCSLVLVCHQDEIAAGFPHRIDFLRLNRAVQAVAPGEQ